MNFNVDMGALLNGVLTTLAIGGIVGLFRRLAAIDKDLQHLSAWKVGIEKEVEHIRERLDGQSRFWSGLAKKQMKHNDDEDAS